MANRKEFHELIPIGRAEALLRSIIRSSTETVPLDLAYHSVLAEDVFAPIDVPSFDRADMDGYAVRAADTYRAREEEPVQLVIAGRIPAGAVPSLTISEGTAAEISTGAMLPAGADAIQYRMNELGFSEDEMPSASTIKRIVKKRGLKVNKRERYKQVKSKKRYTLLNPTQIDEVHQMDFVGPRFIKGCGAISPLHPNRCGIHSGSY